MSGNLVKLVQEVWMKISEQDALRILFPELRDPELERRRLDTLARGRAMFPRETLTPEALRTGIPLPEWPPRR